MNLDNRPKNPHAVALGRIVTPRRLAACARNARLGGKPSNARLTLAEAQELGYVLGKGTVPGGKDDRAGAWYVWRADAEATRLGPGYTSRADALNALADTVVALAREYVRALTDFLTDLPTAPTELAWLRERHPEWLKEAAKGTSSTLDPPG
jgi:hypothetical protein